MIEIEKTSTFKRLLKKFNIKVDLSQFEKDIKEDPKRWPVIRETGGFRKGRVDLEGTGKSGGLRVIYIYIQVGDIVYFVLVYPKNKQENITAEQKKELRKLAKMLKDTK